MTESNNKLPISLKGITSTNDDPRLCAICSGPFPKGPYHSSSLLYSCCGKRVCDSCIDENGIWHRDNCIMCGTDSARFDGLLKKNAKKGQAWAQEAIGRFFYYGNTPSFTKSYYDALRLLRKAATNGHPFAMIMLGEMYKNGYGCERDLALAKVHLERAIAADGMVADAAREALGNVAAGYANNGDFQTAMLIATPLAESGQRLAQYNLGVMLAARGNQEDAYEWLAKAALGASGIAKEAAFEAMRCCATLQMWPQTKFWLSVTTKNLRFLLSDAAAGSGRVVGRVNSCRNAMHDIRNKCGGCGAELCGTTRKKCGGCTAFCYCNRDCQKLHWNRKKNGHREDCKEVMEMKTKMKEARKAKEHYRGEVEWRRIND